MNLSRAAVLPARFSVADAWRALRRWPWFDTARTLRERFREDRLGLTASSLTFTTLISLVPLLTVMLAVFTAFPMFATFQAGLEKYFLQSLVPPNLAKPVLGALTTFASKASRVGTFGLVALGFSAMALMLTIDRTLNAIWRVRRPRPIAQRVLVYWAAVTLGPLVLGASLTLSSYVLSASSGLVSALPGGLAFSLFAAEFVVLASALSGLYHYVPHAPVAWRHALAGGLAAAAAIEVAKRGLGWYLKLTTYSTVYGAFATLPIFLLWIYLGWIIVLLGAVIAAYAPSLQMRVRRHGGRPGHEFGVALQVMRALVGSRARGEPGVEALALAQALHVDPLQLDTVLDHLVGLEWIGRLVEESGAGRYVLLCDPARTPLAPLADALLLAPGEAVATARARLGVGEATLAEALPT